MTIPQTKLTGPEEIRIAKNILDHTREDFSSQYTAEQLLILCRMKIESGWDITPDQWEPRQVREALRGIHPRWQGDEDHPIYDGAEMLDRNTHVRLVGEAREKAPEWVRGRVGTVLFSYQEAKDMGIHTNMDPSTMLCRWCRTARIWQGYFRFEDLEATDEDVTRDE